MKWPFGHQLEIIKFIWIITDKISIWKYFWIRYHEKSWEHPMNIKRSSIEHLENIQDQLWTPKTLLKIWTHLIRSSWKHLRTSKTSIEHLRSSKIIWRRTENPSYVVRLVQYENDFNTQTKMLYWARMGGWISYLRPDQFLDHLTVMINQSSSAALLINKTGSANALPR